MKSMLSCLGRCPRRYRIRLRDLVDLLLVLRKDLQSLVDLGRQGLRRLEQVEEFPVVHLEEHAWVCMRVDTYNMEGRRGWSQKKSRGRPSLALSTNLNRRAAYNHVKTQPG